MGDGIHAGHSYEGKAGPMRMFIQNVDEPRSASTRTLRPDGQAKEYQHLFLAVPEDEALPAAVEAVPLTPVDQPPDVAQVNLLLK